MTTTISESVTDRLRRDILDSVFLPSARLVEAELCERYGVGRAAVRSALIELTGEGLVDRETNRGASVRRVSLEELIQITETRRVLESLIAARAARNSTPAEREELQEIGRRMRKAVADGEVREYSNLNKKLHRYLCVISRHVVADSLVANLRNRSMHHQFQPAMVPDRPKESLRQHEAIIAAVVAGDEKAASEAMVVHLESVETLLRRWDQI